MPLEKRRVGVVAMSMTSESREPNGPFIPKYEPNNYFMSSKVMPDASVKIPNNQRP